jgi:hypothetical protein
MERRVHIKKAEEERGIKPKKSRSRSPSEETKTESQSFTLIESDETFTSKILILHPEKVF